LKVEHLVAYQNLQQHCQKIIPRRKPQKRKKNLWF